MEIDIGQFYNKKSEILNSRKQAILKSLEEEREARRSCIAQGKKFKIDSIDSLGSPISINQENRPLKFESFQETKPNPSKSLVQSSEYSRISDTRPDFMHNQLKEPDFEQLSLIYENYLRSPKVPDQPQFLKKTPKKASPTRSSSAPSTRRKAKTDLVKEREEEFKQNCTFKPKINKLPYKKDLNYEEPSSLSYEQKINQLSRPKSDIVEKREKLKRKQQKIEEAECTFKPCITPYKQINRSFSEYPVEERLYQDAETKFTERERIKREKEEELALKFPYSPQVQGSVSKIIGTKREKPPLYMRLEEVQRDLNEKKKVIRLEAEKNDPDLTFRPQINPYSSQLASIKKSRDQNSKNSSVERKVKLSDQFSIDEKYTFTPRISSYSGNLSTKDFLERQKALQEKIKQKREEMMSRLQSSYTFRPNIDKTSSYIAESNKERSKQRLEERLNKDGQKKIELQALLEQEHYSQYKYEPTINPISKRLGRSSSLTEIAYSNNSKEAKKKIAEENVAEQEKKCSFTPKLNTTKFKYIDSQYKQSNSISKIINERLSVKKQKQEELKKVYEYESMKECTFAPQSTEIKANLEAKVKVKGIERFLELREIAKRKEEELKEREEKVFLTNPSYDPNVPFTVPKPFNLHPSNKEMKIEKIKQELTKKEKNDCLFQPQTNE